MSSYMSDDGGKSIMRILVTIVIVVACVLALFVVGVWAICVYDNMRWEKPLSGTDISQQSTLILGMLGIAFTGKFVQKFAERGVNNKYLSMKIEKNEDDGMSHK